MVETKKELKAMITLFKAHQSLVKYTKEDIKKSNFDLNEFAVLEVIFHYQKISVQKINEKVLVAPSSLSYILDKLVAKKLIKREISPTDKRSYLISLTKLGKDASQDVFPKHYENLKEVFEILSEEEKNQLTYLLKKIGQHVESKLWTNIFLLKS